MAVPTPAAGTGADAYARIRWLIVGGQLHPGARIAEAELAARLGVSRTPAREAMRRLLAEGLLVPNGGGERPRVAVAPVSAADVIELYEAAGALEGVAARRVATLTVQQRRTLARDMKRCENVFRAATRAQPVDYDALFAAHDAVHRTLMDACAGAATSVLLGSLRPRLDRYEWLYAPVTGPPFKETFAEHAAFIRAAAEGNGAACERAVRRNWFEGGKRLAIALERRR
jgi:DNA-binding GntR family transcriptional regulator